MIDPHHLSTIERATKERGTQLSRAEIVYLLRGSDAAIPLRSAAQTAEEYYATHVDARLAGRR